MKVFTSTGVQFPSAFPKPEGARTANPLRLQTLSDRHMQVSAKPPEADHAVTSFADALNQALGNVEALNERSESLTEKAIYDPDSVEAHEVIIATQKARFAMNLTKTLADGAVRSFRELTNPR